MKGAPTCASWCSAAFRSSGTWLVAACSVAHSAARSMPA